MRVLIDSNILVSAAYSKGSIPHQAFKKAVEPPYSALICEQSLEELRRVYIRKFPDKARVFEQFIVLALRCRTRSRPSDKTFRRRRNS